MDTPNEIIVTQENYNDYSTILFQIGALKSIFDKNQELLNEESLNDFYCTLLIKKYLLDTQVFKSNCPKASRDIKTKDELRKANNKRDQRQMHNKLTSQIVDILAQTPPDFHPIETLRDWYILWNNYRLFILWDRIGLDSNPNLANSTAPLNAMNGYASIGFYVLNVLATLIQMYLHWYDTNSLNIETDPIVFLELHKYKFINDLLWAPVNSFFLMNQMIQLCKDTPLIGDALCTGLFFLDIAIGLYRYDETNRHYEKLMKDFMGDLNKNTCVYAKLLKQKEDNLWEQEKNIYLGFFQALAMTTLLLTDVLIDTSLNLILVGAVIGKVSQLCVLTYNFCEKTQGLSDSTELTFRRLEFGLQILQQFTFIPTLLLLSLVIMPHIAGPTLFVTWLLMSFCVLTTYLINQQIQHYIEQHKDNPNKPKSMGSSFAETSQAEL